MKKATPPIDPGACDRYSELFSRSTDEFGGPELNSLIVRALLVSEALEEDRPIEQILTHGTLADFDF